MRTLSPLVGVAACSAGLLLLCAGRGSTSAPEAFVAGWQDTQAALRQVNVAREYRGTLKQGDTSTEKYRLAEKFVKPQKAQVMSATEEGLHTMIENAHRAMMKYRFDDFRKRKPSKQTMAKAKYQIQAGKQVLRQMELAKTAEEEKKEAAVPTLTEWMKQNFDSKLAESEWAGRGGTIRLHFGQMFRFRREFKAKYGYFHDNSKSYTKWKLKDGPKYLSRRVFFDKVKEGRKAVAIARKEKKIAERKELWADEEEPQQSYADTRVEPAQPKKKFNNPRKADKDKEGGATATEAFASGLTSPPGGPITFAGATLALLLVGASRRRR